MTQYRYTKESKEKIRNYLKEKKRKKTLYKLRKTLLKVKNGNLNLKFYRKDFFCKYRKVQRKRANKDH